MNEEIDIESWTDGLVGKALDVFGPRLKLVGIQGSRARGEARPDSDIDVVLVVEGLDDDDLAAYRALLATMPHGDLACGFTGSPELLAAWYKQKCPETKQNLPGYHPGRGAVRQAERKELILSCFPCGNGITSPRRQEEPRGHCRYRSSCKLCAADEPHRTSGKRLRRGWRASSGSCVSYPVLPWKPYT